MSGLAMDFRAGAQGINEGLKYLGSSSGKTDEEIYEIKKKIIDKYISIKFFYYNQILFNKTNNDRMKENEQAAIAILMPEKGDDNYEYIKDLRQEKLLWIDIVFDAFKIIYDKVRDDLRGRKYQRLDWEGDWNNPDKKPDEYIKKITPSMMKRKIESHMIPPPPFDVIGEGSWDFKDPEARTARIMIERGVWKTVDVPEVDHLGIPINKGDKFRIPHPKGPPKTKTEQLFEMIKVRNHTKWEKQSEKTYKKKGIGLALPWVALWDGRTTELSNYRMYNNLRNINEYKWIFEELCRTYSWKRDKEIVKYLNGLKDEYELAFVPSLDRFEKGSSYFIQGQTPVSIYTKNANGGIDGLKWVFPDGSPIEETDTTTGETKGMEMTKMASRQVGRVDEINIEIKNYAEELLGLRKEKIKEKNAYRAARKNGEKEKEERHNDKYKEYKKEIENIKSALRVRKLWDRVEAKADEIYERQQQVNGGRRKVRKTRRVGTRRFRKSKKKITKRKRRKSLFRKKRTKRVVPRRKTRRFRKK